MTEPPVYQATDGARTYAGIDRLPVTVLLDNVRSLYNVGSFFRTADAVRAQKILLAGITADPGDPRMAKTALGAERSMSWARVDDVAVELELLREQGYQLAAIETSVTAVDLFDWRPAFPVCAVFGHEVDGIGTAVQGRCDIHIRIPTLGLKQSLNVATAGGVVLYELLRRYRKLLSLGMCCLPGTDPSPLASRIPNPQPPVRYHRAMSEDEAPKSAYELAMERLRKKDAEAGVEQREVTDAQRAAIAEVRNFYDAKLAEREVLHQSTMRRATEAEAMATMEQEYRRDRERLTTERDNKLDKLRREG